MVSNIKILRANPMNFIHRISLLFLVIISLLLPCFGQVSPGTTKEVEIVGNSNKESKLRIAKLFSTSNGVYFINLKSTFGNAELWKVNKHAFPINLSIDKPFLETFNNQVIQFWYNDSLFIINKNDTIVNYGSKSELNLFSKSFLCSENSVMFMNYPFLGKLTNANIMINTLTGRYNMYFNDDYVNIHRAETQLLLSVYASNEHNRIFKDHHYIIRDIDQYLTGDEINFAYNFITSTHKPFVLFNDSSFYVFDASQNKLQVIDTTDGRIKTFDCDLMKQSRWCEKFYYDPIGKELYTLMKVSYQWQLYKFDWYEKKFASFFLLPKINPDLMVVNNNRLYSFNKQLGLLQSILLIKQVTYNPNISNE